MTKIIEHPYCIAQGHNFMEVAYVFGEYGFICEQCGIDKVDLLKLYTVEETEKEKLDE